MNEDYFQLIFILYITNNIIFIFLRHLFVFEIKKLSTYFKNVKVSGEM